MLAALLTLAVSLLLVCVVFGSNRRHYQSSRIATDDKIELNHVGGETHIVGQNGGGRVPLMGNHHNSHHHHRHNNNSSNHHSGTAVTTNSILSRRTMSNGENNCGSAGGGSGAHDKGKAYKALPTTEPDDSSSELENNGSDLDDCGEVDQDGSGVGIGIGGVGSGGIAISTKAIVSSNSSTGGYNGSNSGSESIGEGARSRISNGPHRHHQQQQQQPQFPLVRKSGVGAGVSLHPCGETKIGSLLSEATQQVQRTSPSHGLLLSSPPQSARTNEIGTIDSGLATVMGASGPSAGSSNSNCNPAGATASSSSRVVGDGGVVGGGIGPSGSASNLTPTSSHLFSDKYPDLIDEKMSLGSDFASLPRPNKNQQQHQHHQLPYKHYAHQKHHLVDST